MKLKLNEIRSLASDTSNKHINSKEDINIQASMYPLFKENALYLEELDVYQTANIIDNVNTWQMLHKKKKLIENGSEIYQSYRYAPRDIVMVRLGGVNIGYEASYNHPAIVISQGYNWVLIAPCSTGQFSKNHNTLIKANAPGDGVNRNTAIQVDKIRVIDKWRIQSKLGRLSANKFTDLTNKFVELYSPYHLDQLVKKNDEILDLEVEKKRLALKVDELENEIEKYKKIEIEFEEFKKTICND